METVGKHLGLILALTAVRSAHADQTPISIDRAGAAESTATVGALRFQVEIGGVVGTDRAEGTRSTTLSAPLLLRFGLGDAIEARLESDGPSQLRTQGSGDKSTTDSGWSGIALGLKLRFYEGPDSVGNPSFALMVGMTVIPIGSGQFRGSGIDPSVALAAQTDLPLDFGLGVSLGASWPDDSGSHVLGSGAVSLSYRMTERIEVFVDLFGDIPSSEPAESTLSLDGGVTLLIAPDVMLDLGAAIGLTDRADDLEVTTGVSVRF